MQFLPTNARRVVIKLGTGLLTSPREGIDHTCLARIAEQVRVLREGGVQVILVSSGAVGLGMGSLGLTRRPTEMAALQGCAAIGQAILMELWREAFAAHDIRVAQVLLTHEDVRARNRHLAVKETAERLLGWGIVPIFNENDTVSAEEIRFGDNDRLSALVAVLTQSDLLVILSTVSGLLHPEEENRLIPVVEKITPEIEALAGGTDSPTAVGGMQSKIEAAKLATRAGCGVFIGAGRDPVVLLHLLGGRATGTFFVPAKLGLQAKKRWIAFFQRPTGTLFLDAGAVTALRESGRSLLAKGITRTEGTFGKGEIVNLATPEGQVFARGVVTYEDKDLLRIAGLDSAAIQKLFPTRKHLEVVHRDGLVLL